MVQPGDHKEENIIHWITNFHAMKLQSGSDDLQPIGISQPRYVEIPPNPARNCDNPLFTASISQHEQTCDPVMIHNELLCFIQNKSETVPVDTLIKLTSEFYSEQEVAAAKKLLFNTVKSSRRCYNRRGDEKTKNDIGDIVRVILELKKDSPVFVAVKPTSNCGCQTYLQLALIMSTFFISYRTCSL